jgi:LysR family hydrogen peroxide-inducible transcriptional activator
MTLAELRFIVELADTRHFGRAAQRCDVTQPNLSVSVRKLEEELGVVLFERTKSGVHPTALGRDIINQARRVLSGVSDIRRLAQAGSGQLQGRLSLGVIHTLAPYLLPQLVPYLAQQVATMPLSVSEGMSAELCKQLRAGSLDAILVSLPFSEPDVVVQPLYDEPLVVIMPPTHILSASQVVDLAALRGQPQLLLTQGHCLREQVLALLPETVLLGDEINSLETLRNMVAAGQGLAVVPRSAATPGICAASRLVARPLAGAGRTLALAWRASFPRHKAIDVLRRSIQMCSGAYWSFTTEPELTELS